MAITTATGVLDFNLGYIVPGSNSTWVGTTGTTWDNLLSWNPTPVNPLIWVTEPIDFGTTDYFNVSISATYTGDLTKYEIWTSSTGAFNGEETKFTINEGDTNVTAFYGRYVRVAAWVYQTGSTTNLQDLQIKLTSQAIDISKSDVSSSGLPTWTSIDSTATVGLARVLDIGRRVSAVVNVHLTPNYVTTGSGGYSIPGDNNQYFEQFDYGQVTIPSIVRKRIVTTATTVASGCGTAFILQNQNGDVVNGTVDVRIRALPEQYMLNGQLSTR
jgi:hypothetical protein